MGDPGAVMRPSFETLKFVTLLTALGGCAGTKKSQVRETVETTVAAAFLPVGLGADSSRVGMDGA